MSGEGQEKRPFIKPLVGTHFTTVDEKFRLLFPQVFRERLGEDFAMCLSEYGCIVAMPKAAFYEMWDEIQMVSRLNPDRRKFSREFMRYAADDLNFDKQGRVVIPPYLRDKGNLKKEIVLSAAGDVVEVWDPVELDKYESDEDGYGGDRNQKMRSAYNHMTVVKGIRDE